MHTTLTLLTVCVGFSIWYYLRCRYILQLGIYFNVLAVMYMALGLILTRLTMGQAAATELEQIGLMSIAAVIGFNLAYVIAGARQAHGSNTESGYLPSHTILLFVVGIALAFEAAAILLIGPLDFLLSDRIARFASIRPQTALFYFANFINVCLPIVLLRYLHFGYRRDLNLLYFILAHGILLGLVTISRYDLSIIVLSVCFFLERYRKIGSRLVFGTLVFSMALTLVFKPSLYQVLLGQSYATNVDLGEYTNWVRHTILLMSRPEVELPHNGYLLALKSLFVMRPEEDTLSEWFLQEFYLERIIMFPGVGYGFSSVWEGYSANGLVGVALHFGFFGACFGLLERSSSPMRQIFIVFALVLTYRLFRSESYNFVKTYAWYFAYPAIAIVLVDKFMNWASRSSTFGTNRWPHRLESGYRHPTGIDHESGLPDR